MVGRSRSQPDISTSSVQLNGSGVGYTTIYERGRLSAFSESYGISLQNISWGMGRISCMTGEENSKLEFIEDSVVSAGPRYVDLLTE